MAWLQLSFGAVSTGSSSQLVSRIQQQAGSAPLFLESLPWTEILTIQESGARLLLVPLGATEQHGPHLPINTDTLLAEAVTWFASARTATPVLPALCYSVSSGHTAKWPGTFSLRHETFLATLRELADWALATRWARLLFVNSHFGNDAILRVAVDMIRQASLGELQVGCCNTFALTPAIWEAFIADAEDLHANRAETDLMLHLAPELVRMEAIEDDPDRTGAKVFSYPVSQTSLNGVTGTPSQASAQRGAALFREMGEALTVRTRSAQEEEPPLDGTYWATVARTRRPVFSREDR